MLDNPLVQISLFAALLFVVLGSKPAYAFTDGLVSGLGWRLKDAGGPTRAGYVVHAIVFFALTYAYLTTFEAGTGMTGMTTCGGTSF